MPVDDSKTTSAHGHGLLTALALPLCSRLGPGILLAVTAACCVACIALGVMLFGPRRG